SANNLEKYYKIFAFEYPEKTLELFINALVSYAEDNVSRSHYEYIALLLKKMSKIENGKKAASKLVADFRLQYKNRRAMMEVLGQF
ncbi:MAG: hypothetical protein FWB99_04880, partial [Treponema sp.]|nr:hypothetical protein [Treponema sp.]